MFEKYGEEFFDEMFLFEISLTCRSRLSIQLFLRTIVGGQLVEGSKCVKMLLKVNTLGA